MIENNLYQTEADLNFDYLARDQVISLSLSLWGPKFGTPKWDGLLLRKKQHLQFLAQF